MTFDIFIINKVIRHKSGFFFFLDIELSVVVVVFFFFIGSSI